MKYKEVNFIFITYRISSTYKNILMFNFWKTKPNKHKQNPKQQQQQNSTKTKNTKPQTVISRLMIYEDKDNLNRDNLKE